MHKKINPNYKIIAPLMYFNNEEYGMSNHLNVSATAEQSLNKYLLRVHVNIYSGNNY